MQDQYSRTELLIGREGMDRLKGAHVAVFGIGGVGGYAVEALSRSGVGQLDLIDDDRVCLSNLNRQLHATRKTLGQYKTDVARERILEINPEAQVRVYHTFYMPDTADSFDFAEYDYVIDAIDTVTGKLELAERALRAGTPVISSMGAGNKMDPTGFVVADLSETSVCPLARTMRRELKKREIYHLKVVYSREIPRTPVSECPQACQETAGKRRVPGSNAFVPAAAGLILAGEVFRDLTEPGRYERHMKKYSGKKTVSKAGERQTGGSE
ncbi:MAG: tRNA threonylcarbamoyladenosine dehydratase [Clostridiales bacterium]|nr:tRNA threonylcarbamoyladenosine dehydratase [Clostridiales bacterium]